MEKLTGKLQTIVINFLKIPKIETETTDPMNMQARAYWLIWQSWNLEIIANENRHKV